MPRTALMVRRDHDYSVAFGNEDKLLPSLESKVVLKCFGNVDLKFFGEGSGVHSYSFISFSGKNMS